ncbi:group III truncated hemoglobin [Aminobacter sp. SR38]|uniref:group III truncated hemoglobin n=1 Tax=Aminobacter sp. SR38 TaxID=2774562 RepID=UPI00352C6939
MDMSAGTKEKPTIVIDGRVLPGQLDEQMIHAVVHGFYDEIRKDALLGPVFNGAIAPHDWPRHLAKMCDFWSSLMLRTASYEGRPLPPHLALPDLGRAAFPAMAGFVSLHRRQAVPAGDCGAIHGSGIAYRAFLSACARLQPR